ncbi:MAG TPA: hypothetical protein VKW76_08625 [Candidatus Binatia bacterium]|nr:hypothetical protein [Candidatus Binatia bacterium]
MNERPSGVVLAFRRRCGVPPAARPSRPALVVRNVALDVGTPAERADAGRNAQWNRLVALAADAWCWRDPESLEGLRERLARLRAVVDREWSS